ncbi:potassium channel family protein [Mobiluncus curtisii]|uniref:Trk system potassium uptake protein trkA n=1 Tax=Mobiluncus curtisii TaxID=2051 RepID=A0A2X3DVP5_9ACTO|nr:NAD-binding protein [Mobiluncus curtisii]SQC02280.1 Trk system potassium uptake protein trkA [Mobiluncus curtisii]
MLIVIAGAGSIGRSIARELLARGHQVTIADSSPEAMKVSSVPEANWILGDLSTPETMEQAGAAQADVVVASTGNDQANLVIALLAKTPVRGYLGWWVGLIIPRMSGCSMSLGAWTCRFLLPG